MQGGPCSRAAATRRIIGGLAALALALGLGACGSGDDEQQPASATSTKAERVRTTPVLPKKAGPPKVPEQVAGDVTTVREALEGAGFTVEVTRGSGRSLAQLQVGDALVSFYRSAADASKDAAAFEKVLASGSGGGAVRAAGKRLYISGEKSAERFSKIVSTSEGAL